MSKVYNLSDEDSREWLDNVRYSAGDTFSLESLNKAVETLVRAGTTRTRIPAADFVSYL